MARRAPKSRNISVYSNLAHKRRTKKDKASRSKAEYLATLPKDPVRRILYRLHPKRVAKYWFSKKGGIMALKIFGVAILVMFLAVGAMFAYFRKDLDSISPSQLANRVQTTVTTYYDRNDQVLWQDKGSDNYRLVVKGSDINTYMKQATVAIEDKDYYKHGAISITGILRSAISNANGNTVQGGSTLTQQLVKQVFFPPSQTLDRGIGGIPRKIKEIILSVEVERMYSKSDILNLYLNESPYGGRRNGVESAAQTYFGVDAKDLTLPEAALLAAIPNQPGLYDPYYVPGNSALISRQQKTLDNMAKQGYITQDQANEAKKYPILDHIKPSSAQYADIKAPHFVQMVRNQLEQKLGKTTVGQGGLNVYTTLDLNIQNALQGTINDMFDGTTHCNDSQTGGKYNCVSYAGFSNGAAAIEDNATGQLLAMVGSRDFSYPGFGQDNAAVAFIQPGSSIKPLVYAQLFQDQGAGKQNYGSGSIIPDIKTTFPGNYTPQDDDGVYKGNIPILDSLDWSRNVPAVAAMAIAGQKQTINTIQAMGDSKYCTQGPDAQVGLSAAIGGCGTRLIDHTNAMASLARGGNYLPQSTVLKVTNSQGQVLQQFKQPAPKQVINPQAAYIVNQILGDSKARGGLYNGDYLPILDKQGIKVAAKTGTSNAEVNNKPVPKDIWTVGYTPALSAAVWLGNPDTTPLRDGNSLIPAKIFDAAMSDATAIYVKEGKAKNTDWFTAPQGIQVINGYYYPSYYSKSSLNQTTAMSFDKVSKKLATSCTPPAAQIQVPVTKFVDPYSKKITVTASDGYDPNSNDNVHNCDDQKPSVGQISVTPSGSNYKITVPVTAGKNPLQSIDISVNGQVISSQPASGSQPSYSTVYAFPSSGAQNITATVTDNVYYTGTGSYTYPNS